MNKILFLLLASLLIACGPSDKCKKILGTSIDGTQWITESDRIEHESALIRMKALELETSVVTENISQLTADTVLLNYKAQIESHRIDIERDSRLCGCK